MKKLAWPFSFYLLFYAAMAFLIPFIVLFYQQLNFTGAQIGLLTGIPPLITLAAGPLWTSLADSTRRHNLILGMGLVTAAAAIFLLPSMTSFTAIFILIILFNIFISPVGSLNDSATMSMLGEARAMYGRVRLGGTIGWGVFAQVAGFVLAATNVRLLFYVFAGIMLVNFFVGRKLTFSGRGDHEAPAGNLRTLLTSRRWIFFLLAAFIGGLGSASVASFLSPYLKEMGANGSLIGSAITIATVTELPVFFFGDRLVKRFTPYGLFLASLVLIGLRSILFGLAGSIFLALVVQALGGALFPAMWSAGVAYADEHAPAGLKSTAQGLFGAASFGFGSAVGGFICGLLLESIGGRGMYFVLGVIMLVGLAIIEGVRRLVPEKVGPQPVPLD